MKNVGKERERYRFSVTWRMTFIDESRESSTRVWRHKFRLKFQLVQPGKPGLLRLNSLVSGLRVGRGWIFSDFIWLALLWMRKSVYRNWSSIGLQVENSKVGEDWGIRRDRERFRIFEGHSITGIPQDNIQAKHPLEALKYDNKWNSNNIWFFINIPSAVIQQNFVEKILKTSINQVHFGKTHCWEHNSI